MVNITALNASYGDCLLISYDENGRTRNILIDGGIGKPCFRKLKDMINGFEINNLGIDLLILTHIDDDHISGIIKVFEDTTIPKGIIKKIWFNSGKLLSFYFDTTEEKTREIPLLLNNEPTMSVRQGVTLEKICRDLDIQNKELIKAGDSHDIYGAKITVLSPDISSLQKLNTKWTVEANDLTQMSSKENDYRISLKELLNNQFIEDNSIPNMSSIAFLFDYRGIKLLMLSDAQPSIVINSLESLGYSATNKLAVDFVKVSHHGSKRNTNAELLSYIKCSDYLISSDGSRHGLPHKECLARIISSQSERVNFIFNYDISDNIFLPEDKTQFEFKITTSTSIKYSTVVGVTSR